jgi:ketosteroid isomerase-like protein
MLNKTQLIDLVENQYFEQMDLKRLDETLRCLAPDCVWRIYPAGITLNGRDDEIRNAFKDAMAKYPTMWHGDFDCIVDEQAQRICATFNVRLVDAKGAETTMSNAKIFRVREGKFIELDLYFSSATAIIHE